MYRFVHKLPPFFTPYPKKLGFSTLWNLYGCSKAKPYIVTKSQIPLHPLGRYVIYGRSLMYRFTLTSSNNYNFTNQKKKFFVLSDYSTVLTALKSSSGDVTKFSQVLKEDVFYLELYIEYCGNFPYSEIRGSKYSQYFGEVKKKLKHELSVRWWYIKGTKVWRESVHALNLLSIFYIPQLSDLLIMPIQRLHKYKLMLEQVYSCFKQTERNEEANLLKEALISLNVTEKFSKKLIN